MTDREDMLDMFKGLIGMADEKPFECVGSREEIDHFIARHITATGDIKIAGYVDTVLLRAVAIGEDFFLIIFAPEDFAEVFQFKKTGINNLLRTYGSLGFFALCQQGTGHQGQRAALTDIPLGTEVRTLVDGER